MSLLFEKRLQRKNRKRNVKKKGISPFFCSYGCPKIENPKNLALFGIKLLKGKIPQDPSLHIKSDLKALENYPKLFLQREIDTKVHSKNIFQISPHKYLSLKSNKLSK